MNHNKSLVFNILIYILIIGNIFSTSCQSSEKKTKSKKQPNIIFLLTDDHRFDVINALGNKEVYTPNIDKLVKEGTTFTHAHIMGGNSGAVCLPSRAMIMTSNYVSHLDKSGGAIGNDEIILPQAFRKEGYQTFGTGKWHNRAPAYARSFTTGANIFMGGMSDHLKTPIHDFDSSGKYPKNKSRVEDKFSSVLFREATVAAIENRDKKKPFFMYVAFTSPHDPRMAPEEYTNKYNTDEISLPKNYMPGHPFDNGELIIRDENLLPFPRTKEDVKTEIASYYAMVSEVDDNIGRILEALEKSGEAENTIIVLAGDNGLAVGQHGLVGKQNLYDHSVRVPLIFKGPGIKKGVKTDALVLLNDIFPTLTELAGVNTPKGLDGSSLVSILDNPKNNVRESVFFIYKNFQRGVRTKDWKLINYLVEGKKTTQLFKINEDPLELNNLANDPNYKSKVAELTAIMKDWINKSGDKVDLDKNDWGVPVINSWVTDRKSKGLSLNFKGDH